jgi:hypothetical protein
MLLWSLRIPVSCHLSQVVRRLQGVRMLYAQHTPASRHDLLLQVPRSHHITLSFQHWREIVRRRQRVRK